MALPRSYNRDTYGERMTSSSKIVVFCGKGGVGKTTLCLAHAVRQATLGRKVVVVSSHPPEELRVAVSLDALARELPETSRMLSVVYIEPRTLLADVVRASLPVGFVAEKILDSSIYRNLLEVAPGLKEFYFLARLQQLAERRIEARSTAALDFDLLLWDAPATGHFLAMLRSARRFETYATGPLAAAGADFARFFSSVDRVGAVPVTTLEEMAVEETTELTRVLAEEFLLRSASVVMNLVSPLLAAPDADVEALHRQLEGGSDATLRFALDRTRIERARAAEIRRRVTAPLVAVERVRGGPVDLDLLLKIGPALDALAK